MSDKKKEIKMSDKKIRIYARDCHCKGRVSCEFCMEFKNWQNITSDILVRDIAFISKNLEYENFVTSCDLKIDILKIKRETSVLKVGDEWKSLEDISIYADVSQEKRKIKYCKNNLG